MLAVSKPEKSVPSLSSRSGCHDLISGELAAALYVLAAVGCLRRVVAPVDGIVAPVVVVRCVVGCCACFSFPVDDGVVEGVAPVVVARRVGGRCMCSFSVFGKSAPLVSVRARLDAFSSLILLASRLDSVHGGDCEVAVVLFLLASRPVRARLDAFSSLIFLASRLDSVHGGDCATGVAVVLFLLASPLGFGDGGDSSSVVIVLCISAARLCFGDGADCGVVVVLVMLSFRRGLLSTFRPGRGCVGRVFFARRGLSTSKSNKSMGARLTRALWPHTSQVRGAKQTRAETV